MKRIAQIALTLGLVMLIPSAFISAQDKKEEKHIKVVVSEKGGEKIVIDTVFTGKVEEPLMVLKGDDGEKIVIVNSTGHSSGNEGSHSMSWSSSSSKGGKANVIYINEDNDNPKEGEVKYNVEVRTDESGNKTEKTSYVIAKDGMVVTIEGGSEEMVKELAGVIESSLGVSKEGKTKTDVVKEETKKTTKK